MIKMTRHNRVVKCIAIYVIVCLFILNSTVLAYSDALTDRSNVDLLATQSIFKALSDEGIQRSAELEFEIIAGAKLLMSGKSPVAANGYLIESHKVDGGKRKIEYLKVIDNNGNRLVAQFKLAGVNNNVFEIHLKNGFQHDGEIEIVKVKSESGIGSSVKLSPISMSIDSNNTGCASADAENILRRLFVERNPDFMDDFNKSIDLGNKLIRFDINRVVVVGNSLEMLPLYLALLGKEVIYVDVNESYADKMARYWDKVSSEAGGSRARMSGLLRVIKCDIGKMDLNASGIEPHSCDLVTILDLVGGSPKGSPEEWFNKIGQLLGPDKYLITDETDWSPLIRPITPIFYKAFPKAERVLEGKISGGYSVDGRSYNGMFRIGGKPENDTLLRATINDHKYLLAKIREYMGGYPVNVHIDLTVIPTGGLDASGAEEELSQNIETIARLIALHNSFNMDTRYIIEHPDPAYRDRANTMLKDRLIALGSMPGVNRDELLSRISAPHIEKGVINISLQNSANIEKAGKLADNEYIVGLKDDISASGISIPNYVTASIVGMSIAALKIAREKASDGEYGAMCHNVRDKLNEIYKRCGISTDGFTDDVVNMMVNGASDTRLYYAALYALPPIVKAAIDKLRYYHRALQLLLQAA